MGQTLREQIAELETERAALRQQIAAKDAQAAEWQKARRKGMPPPELIDVLPLRDRLQVVETKLTRLRNRAW